MIKKIILTTAILTLIFSTLSFANNIVPCATYLAATQYSRGIDKSHHENLLVKRKINNGISQEQYIFPNGKVLQGQSRVVLGKTYCASYAKHSGKYVQYATYVIYKKSVGYAVHVKYINGDKQRLHVYPMTKIQFNRDMQSNHPH